MTNNTLYGEDLREAIQERSEWLSSMNRSEADVLEDENDSEYIMSQTPDIKVYLPAPLQHIFE